MGFKVAQLTYTNARGLVINGFVAFGGIDETWRSDNNFIKFDVFASSQEYGRGANQIIETFRLPITHEEVLEIFSRTGNVGFEISETVWQLGSTRQFIPDFSETDGNNDRAMHLKSFTDLGAIIIDLGE